MQTSLLGITMHSLAFMMFVYVQCNRHYLFCALPGKLAPLPCGTKDPRLQQPPFSTNTIRYVVCRHKIRAAQSFHNAMMNAAAVSQPVYVMKALDVAKTEDNHLFTSVERTRLLDNPDITATKRTPGILALHHEMTLSLNTKDCLTFGLMNGCECVLEQIIFE